MLDFSVLSPVQGGFVAISTAPGPEGQILQQSAVAAAVPDSVWTQGPGLRLGVWGDGVGAPTTTAAMVLNLDVRSRQRTVGADEVRRMLVGPDKESLRTLMPPFAAVTLRDEDTLVACTDLLGFRHLYYARGPGWAAASTSARVLAALAGAGLDQEAVAVQCMLGWQLSQRTLFAGVEKVPAGGLLTIRHGRAELDSFGPEEPPPPVGLTHAVTGMRDLLRDYLSAYLDDHPDAILQLTGGQDSRLLLSAIPQVRRPGVAAMTLGLPGNPDVVIAADLTSRYGMKHEVLTLDGLDDISPSDAYERCLDAAGRLELMADPLARAALDFAESRALPGPRISGLGGEEARGLYYLGRGMSAEPTLRRTRRLTDWRMFANEAVTPTALEPEFAAWARDFATRDVHRILSASGEGWFAATDTLYLGHRMQRWAGGTETAVCAERASVNPMLDDRFIATAGGLSPADKRNSRFLSRLQVALDEELARIPLDGRPSPRALASPGLMNAVSQGKATLVRGGHKLSQRLAGRRRPPAGGAVLSAAVVQHWRENPSLLDGVASAGMVRPDWIGDLVAGGSDPEPSAVAFLLNLALATEVVGGSGQEQRPARPA